MDSWTYVQSHTGDLNWDLAGLMVATLAHVCFAMLQSNLATTERKCFNLAISRVDSLYLPGDETDVYEKFTPRLLALEAKL
jgi:hypothetical protein